MSATEPSMRDRGFALLRSGSFAAGIDALYEAIREHPRDAEIYIAIGFAYAQQGDTDNAIDILEKGIDAAPESARLHYNLGVAYHRAHRLTPAKEEYLRALGLDPTYETAKQALDVMAKGTAHQTAS